MSSSRPHKVLQLLANGGFGIYLSMLQLLLWNSISLIYSHHFSIFVLIHIFSLGFVPDQVFLVTATRFLQVTYVCITRILGRRRKMVIYLPWFKEYVSANDGVIFWFMNTWIITDKLKGWSTADNWTRKSCCIGLS